MHNATPPADLAQTIVDALYTDWLAAKATAEELYEQRDFMAGDAASRHAETAYWRAKATADAARKAYNTAKRCVASADVAATTIAARSSGFSLGGLL